MNIQGLLRKTTARLSGLKQRQTEREAASIWEEWTNEAVLRTLQLVGKDGTLPDDFDERVAAIDQELASLQTEEEKAAIALFETRYAADISRAHQELLAQLQSNE